MSNSNYFDYYKHTSTYQVYENLCEGFNDVVDEERFVKVYEAVNQAGNDERAQPFRDGTFEFLVNMLMFHSDSYDEDGDEAFHECVVNLSNNINDQLVRVKFEEKDSEHYQQTNLDKYSLTFLYDICNNNLTLPQYKDNLTEEEIGLLRELNRVLFVKCSEYCLPF